MLSSSSIIVHLKEKELRAICEFYKHEKQTFSIYLIKFLLPGNAVRMYTPVDDSFDRYLLYLAKPYVTFRVRACESASITLMPDPQGTWWIDGYQIVLGSYANTKSEIRPGYNATGKLL